MPCADCTTESRCSHFGLCQKLKLPYPRTARAEPAKAHTLTDEDRSDLRVGSCVFKVPPYDKNPQSQRIADLMLRLADGVGEAPEPRYRCVKCGYIGPDQIHHQRPNGTGECGYIAALVKPAPGVNACEGGGQG